MVAQLPTALEWVRLYAPTQEEDSAIVACSDALGDWGHGMVSPCFDGGWPPQWSMTHITEKEMTPIGVAAAFWET